MDNPGQQTALVVSPWPTDREFVVWLLGQRRIACREAGSIKAASVALSRDRFDLLVLDFNLIGNDGELRQIRESAPTTPFVIVAESTGVDTARALDDQMVFLHRGQLTYHLLEKLPGHRLEDRVLRIIQARLLEWARPVFPGVDPTDVDLQLLSEIVASWLRRRRLVQSWTDELWTRARPAFTILLISAAAYVLQQWVGIVDWKAILRGLGAGTGS